MSSLTFDISDDQQFRQYCVQQFTKLDERTSGLSELREQHAVLKQEVSDIRQDMKDEKFWGNVKIAIAPLLVVLHGLGRALGLHI
jgi:hypothetical protein